MWFTVTSEDIDSGSPSSGASCPIARSVVRTLGLKHGDIWVFPESIIRSNWKGHSYNLPPEARWFVAAFDSHEQVYPFSFMVRTA